MMNSKARNSFFVWIISILFFSSIVFINSSSGILSKNSAALFVFLGSILIGIVSFVVFFFSFISHFRKKGWFNVGNRLIKFLKIILIVFTLPLIFLFEVIKPLDLIKIIKKGKAKTIPSKQFFKNIFFGLLIIIFLFPLWVGGYWIVGEITAQQLGYIPEDITIVGTGSMYPTWPKGTKGKTPKELVKEVVGTAGFLKYPNGVVIAGNRILGHRIERGDIVVVENDKTRKANQELYGYPSGVLKRLIAIGGDTLEIRDGIVYLNNQPLKEPYIAKARSTFGESFLKECQKVTIPTNSIFVMGDNRKGSGDSREDGFFSINDIKYVLPLKDQKGDLVKNWRDTSKDFDELSKIKLDKGKYLEFLNEKRKDVGAKPLKYQSQLEKSAFKRGEVILKYDDFSYEATRSGYTQLRAMNEIGYSNITYGEVPTLGYYEAEELIENQFEFPESKKFFNDKNFQEVGIAEVEGMLNGCPAQIIVQHFAGYVPPNYTSEDIQSWGSVINDLNNVIPSWEKVKGYPNVNQDDLNKLLGIMYQRKNQAEAIYYRMKVNQWLTNAEKQMMNNDQALSEQENALAKKLNGN